MAMIAESRRNAFWFGTEEKMGWFPTPNRGAQTGGSGWAAEGTTLNGGGFQLNSFGSHRQYIFEWPNTSSAKMAQTMKSYADGSFGRGLIYFLDPLIYTTNVLPAMWADPSMGIGQEGASLVYGVEASGLPTSDNPNDLPVKSAYYDLGSIADGWRGKEDAVFVPVPEGYTFSFGSIHSQTGQGRVLYRTQSRTGALGAVTAVTPLLENTSQLVNTFISGPDLAGVWLFVGKVGAGAGSVTLTAMTGRLLPAVKAVVTPVATNLFTNPRLVGDGTYAEVRRNLAANPRMETAGGLIPQSLNNTAFPITRAVDIPVPHPLGFTKATEGGYALGPTSRTLSVYNLDRLAPGSPERMIGCWVLSNEPGYQVRAISGFTTAPLPANQWVFIATVSPIAADGFSFVDIETVDGSVPSPTARGYVTGVISKAGTVPVTPEDYFDGSTPDFTVDPDMRQRWVGAPNASESVMEVQNVAGVSGGYVTSDWPDYDTALRVPEGSTASFTANSGETVAVMARNAGQTINGAPVVEGLNHVPGAASMVLGAGDWALPTRVADPAYVGPAFSGSSGTIMIGSQLATTEWDGAEDNSTSTAYSTSTELINIRKGPWIGGQGHSGCRFIGKPTEIKYGPFNGGQVGFAASFREVGSWLYG